MYRLLNCLGTIKSHPFLVSTKFIQVIVVGAMFGLCVDVNEINTVILSVGTHSAK